MESDEQFVDPTEVAIEVRLSFLKKYAKNLVPDISEGIDAERREALKKEKEETDIRIDELEKLLKKMKEN